MMMSDAISRCAPEILFVLTGTRLVGYRRLIRSCSTRHRLLLSVDGDGRFEKRLVLHARFRTPSAHGKMCLP